jgi:molybdenum cofactor guanylyltransferase
VTHAVTALVLAGGAAIRMGGSKTGCRIGGSTLLGRSLKLADAMADEVLLLPGRRSLPAEAAGRRCVADWGHESTPTPTPTPTHAPEPELAGPLAALGAGLEAARHEWCLLLPCDLPWLSAPVLGRLISQALRSPRESVAVRDEAGWQPFLALYRRTLATRVQAELDAGRRSLAGLLEHSDVEAVQADSLRDLDPDLRCLLNVNTPADLEAARLLECAR